MTEPKKGPKKKVDPSLPKNKGGRPTILTEELADLICKRVASNDVGLKKLCEMFPDMPCKDTINVWRWEHDWFSAQYVKAKQLQAEISAEACLEIADDATNDWMETIPKEDQPIGWRLNGEHVQRSRLRIDTRKWLAAKLAPKIYGVQQVDDKSKSPSEIEKMLLNSD